MSPARLVGEPRRTMLGLMRIGLYGLCGVLTVADRPSDVPVLWLVVLAVVSATAMLTPTSPALDRLVFLVEAWVTALMVTPLGGDHPTMLPYLLAPSLSAGIRFGLLDAVTVPGSAAAWMLAGAIGHPLHGRSSYLTSAAQWALVSLLIGLLGASGARLRMREEQVSETMFREAFHLLGQLRPVARRLPGTLEPSTAAYDLLDACLASVGATAGAVLRKTEGNRLVPIAMRGWAELPQGSLSDPDNLLPAVLAGRPTLARVDPADPTSAMLVAIPIQADETPVGLVVVEPAEGGRLTPAEIKAVQAAAATRVLRLEAAMLFDEVRALATIEERQRLAREIHDGIAQELASLGYAIDNVSHLVKLGDEEASSALRRLREDLSDLISELRLSIFDLRATVDPQGGLATTLGDYVTEVGASTGMTVHLSLRGSRRLPAPTEAELLRIAQESITNARKHAGAHNLWVTLDTGLDQPMMRIDDDGIGRSSGGGPGFGMEIMQERAARIGADLKVSARMPRGTRVEVLLDPTVASGTGPQPHEAAGNATAGRPA